MRPWHVGYANKMRYSISFYFFLVCFLFLFFSFFKMIIYSKLSNLTCLILNKNKILTIILILIIIRGVGGEHPGQVQLCPFIPKQSQRESRGLKSRDVFRPVRSRAQPEGLRRWSWGLCSSERQTGWLITHHPLCSALWGAKIKAATDCSCWNPQHISVIRRWFKNDLLMLRSQS